VDQNGSEAPELARVWLHVNGVEHDLLLDTGPRCSTCSASSSA
jgi:hypothetical protein